MSLVTPDVHLVDRRCSLTLAHTAFVPSIWLCVHSSLLDLSPYTRQVFRLEVRDQHRKIVNSCVCSCENIENFGLCFRAANVAGIAGMCGTE